VSDISKEWEVEATASLKTGNRNPII